VSAHYYAFRAARRRNLPVANRARQAALAAGDPTNKDQWAAIFEYWRCINILDDANIKLARNRYRRAGK
jgi:hypothetical protein